MFTINNPTGALDFVEQMQYLIYSEEMSSTGTHHFQGYVYFRNPQTMEGAKRALEDETAHLEIRRGTHEEAKAYASKTTDPTFLSGPYEFGEEPQQGRRNDLEHLGSRILQGERADDVILEGGATAIR